MFEKVNRRDVTVAALLMVLIYFSMAIFLPIKTIPHCSGGCDISNYNNTNTTTEGIIPHTYPDQTLAFSGNQTYFREPDRFVLFTRNGLTLLVGEGQINVAFQDDASPEEIATIHAWLLGNGAKKIGQDPGLNSVMYEIRQADMNRILDFLDNQPSILTALPNAAMCPEPICTEPTYEEPFPQYYNLRLVLMLLVGPGLYVFRNRPGIRDFVEAMVLLAFLSYLFYGIVYVFLPDVMHVLGYTGS